MSDYILLGGGLYLLEAIEILNEALGRSISVLSSARILETEIDGRSFEQILRDRAVEFRSVERLDIQSLKKESFFKKDSNVFSFGAPWIIRKDFLDYFQGNIYNFHGTKLPKDGGGGLFSWQILRDLSHGMCLVHKIDEGVDTGNIVYYEDFLFSNCRRPIDYINKYKEKFCPFFRKFIQMLESGHNFKQIAQPEYLATYWPRLNTELHGWINWEWSIEEVYKFICAFDEPYKGAHTFIKSKKVYLKDALMDRNEGSFHPFQYGIIFRITGEHVFIACKDGALIIRDIKDAQNQKIKLNVGDRFYTTRELLDSAMSKRTTYTPKGMK